MTTLVGRLGVVGRFPCRHPGVFIVMNIVSGHMCVYIYIYIYIGRGDDTVGKPRRAQIPQFELFELKISQFDLFELVLSLKSAKQII